MPGFTQVFGGQNIYPSKVTKLAIALTADLTLQWPVEQAIAGATVFADIMDVTPDAGGRSLLTPDARRAAPGQATLVNNLGAFTFTMKDNLGNAIGAVPSGQVWQFYLADNSTQAGTWRGFQFGTGASSASAAALAGAGLKAIATTLNETMVPSVAAITPLTLVNADRATVKVWTGGAGVFNLPNPATVGSDWFATIINAGTGNLTVTPAAGLINGAATKTFSPNDSSMVITDGLNYYTLGFGNVPSPFFDFNSINVAGTGNYTLSGTELNRIVYRLTGLLSGNRNIIVPGTVQQYWVDNRTTGAFTLTVKTLAGVGVVVPQGSSLILYSDGTDVYAGNGSPTGGVLPVASGGTGLSAVAQGDLLYGSAPNTLARLAKDVTATRYLANTGAANNPAWAQVNLANGVTGRLTFANIPQGSGFSVLGVTGAALADFNQIVGGANGVLRVDSTGTSLAFGLVNLAASVTGSLGVTNGGTGLGSTAQGDLLYADAANSLARLAKDTVGLKVLSNTGASNAPAWIYQRFTAQSAANSDYTFALTDRWSWTPHTGAATQNWTVPPNGTVAFDVGTMIGIDNRAGAGALTIIAGAGVTIDGHGTTATSATFMVLPVGYKMMLVKMGTDTWMAFTDAPISSSAVGAVFAGYVGADGATGNILPVGWSVSGPSGSQYTLTHNLGLANTLGLAIVVTPVAAASNAGRIETAPGANSFIVTTYTTSTGAAANSAFYFHAVRIAA